MIRLKEITRAFIFIGAISALFIVTSSLSYHRVVGKTYAVTVEIKNIRNKKGRIQLQIYRDQESFAKEKPWQSVHVPKKNTSGGILTHTIKGLPYGVYGIALLDDENSDTKMDYGWLMPKEGFGFSDYYHTSWSRPTFHDFKFYLKENKKVTMKIRYL